MFKIKTNVSFLGILICIGLCIGIGLLTEGKARYRFSADPIDVIIPCTKKDLVTLNDCIQSIRSYGKGIRNIYVISAQPLTDQATWIDEAIFPFTKEDVAFQLCREDKEATLEFLTAPSRVGWYYQQLLKYYAPFVVPDISSNVLILDSDTVFLEPVEFLTAEGAGLYATGRENHLPYFEHAKKLIPGFKKHSKKASGICHHMVFQRPVLEDLFADVENRFSMPFWQAFCLCVSPLERSGSGASEYEIYFNFVFSRTKQVKIRRLRWKNVDSLDHLDEFRNDGYNYVSWHSWAREDLDSETK
ncbi:MAG: hypothetical protein JSR39_11400 [Verrucomicrobia bacterium]|nr:hypothetical protein [Verrucomicrobiota bacterium]